MMNVEILYLVLPKGINQLDLLVFLLSFSLFKNVVCRVLQSFAEISENPNFG